MRSEKMTKPGEHKTVQSRIRAYAQEIGWTYVPRAEAERRRGFDPVAATPIHKRRLFVFAEADIPNRRGPVLHPTGARKHNCLIPGLVGDGRPSVSPEIKLQHGTITGRGLQRVFQWIGKISAKQVQELQSLARSQVYI